MFARVLIADRGEFAPHIVRACRELEIATVEAHTDEQAEIIATASSVGADAVHPGHGVRSADADFAEACWDNGFTFIGPPPDVLARLADRAATRALMAAAGVPVVPDGDESPTGRRVEVQVLADVHGNAVHLGARDRTPRSIGDGPTMLPAGSARRIGQAALRGVDAVAYLGAGTFEFLVEPDGGFSFLDIDCRIPADHPVVAGFDLVREQIRIAQDLPLSLRQQDVPPDQEVLREVLRDKNLRVGQVIDGRPHVAAEDQ